MKAGWLLWLAVFAGSVDHESELARAVELSGAGRYAEAVAALTDLAEAAREAGDTRRHATILRERGVSFLHHGAYEDARHDFETARDLYDSIQDDVGAARVRLRLASMTSHADPAAALAIVEDVETRMAELGEVEVLLQAKLFRARAEVMGGDYETGLATLAPLEEAYADDPKRLTDVLNLKSWALQQNGLLEPARASYRRLIDVAFATGNQRLVTYAYCNLGDVEAELGFPRAAEAHVDRAIARLDLLRASIPAGVDERTTFLDAQVSAYHRKIRILLDEHRDPPAAFAIAERYHAKSLLEEMRTPPAEASDTLNEEERGLLLDLVEAQEALLDGGTAESLRTFEKRWETARRQSLRRSNPVAASYEQATPEEIRKRLPDGTAMLAYWVQPERTLLWVLRADRIELVQIPIERERLSDRIERHVAPLRDRVRAEDLEIRGETGRHIDDGRRLHDLLVAPAHRHLDGVEHLIVVPDDILWKLPFETLISAPAEEAADSGLWFSAYRNVRFLAHDFSVLYAPSASVWLELAGRGSAGRGLLAVAPTIDEGQAARERGLELGPLPGAKAEASGIAQRIDGGDALLGARASERAVKQALPDRRFVHFAAHGYLHDRRPQLSGIVLRPDRGDDPGEDGLFQGFEVRTLDLRAELVSLAACNSGLGQLSRAEGVLGVARSFLLAGSRNVMVSLWPVDDAASHMLVDRFYDELLEGRPLPQALRLAKLALLGGETRERVVTGHERVSYAHPYFWSTYVLLGGDRLEPPPISRRPRE